MSYRNTGLYEAAVGRSFPNKISFGPTIFHKTLAPPNRSGHILESVPETPVPWYVLYGCYCVYG
jgi:hypothetical protein